MCSMRYAASVVSWRKLAPVNKKCAAGGGFWTKASFKSTLKSNSLQSSTGSDLSAGRGL